ncbi:unnamed protein product [Rangifer tarandus platyrhynchus]|uniref:Uncharacterized protein n=1 Tax=Rangifer tarandus platyrhynchus TaxID=3082113 RepID=A0ABN9A1R6_RANTA|nr:unnamed protein product [Rangifer tarandus platyrhynchus]
MAVLKLHGEVKPYHRQRPGPGSQNANTASSLHCQTEEQINGSLALRNPGAETKLLSVFQNDSKATEAELHACGAEAHGDPSVKGWSLDACGAEAQGDPSVKGWSLNACGAEAHGDPSVKGWSLRSCAASAEQGLHKSLSPEWQSGIQCPDGFFLAEKMEDTAHPHFPSGYIDQKVEDKVTLISCLDTWIMSFLSD